MPIPGQEKLKILFAGGGTGGHLFSGIAVAEEIRRRMPKAEVLFVGTPFGLEKSIVPEAGFPLRFIEATPLKGSGWSARLKSLLRLPRAYGQSKKILKEFSPDVVVGIGGYASGPLTLAAHFSKIPTAIIEQNSIPGFTNRQLGRFVDKIFIAFARAAAYFNAKKTLLSGNPTRRFELPTLEKESDRCCIFILGGSQGAHTLNVAMMEALPLLKADLSRFHFIHQSGPQDFAAVEAAYQKYEAAAEVFAFSQNLSPHFARADLMVCRAGAGTITELQNLGLPAILVPYPFAADDHQLGNAEEMVEAGAAELILNKDFNGARLAERLRHYLTAPELRRQMKQAALRLAKPEAAAEVFQACLALIRKTQAQS
ncbi:MAG TPA: undecaprenyldiphospho-muramoylpentapeptide beta-N-acetylglucosaminyltransferase [Deltaproteobacteria bacterium]|nr:undecaprenyldiphospho-muramoylpentapeptide beta-N-acetylglucosaminyltransferase [Deltaproteobacteria bacterium]